MPHVHVTPLEIARLRFDLTAAYALPPGHPAAGAPGLPVLAYHLALPRRSVLVDAPLYEAASTPDVYLLPGFVAPPPLPDQLRAAGIEPAGVTDVVLSHAHFDHLGGLERRTEAGTVPTFPNARHYLGRGDWDPAAFTAMAREDLLTVERAGLLTLVDGDLDLGDGLSLVAAPGESPGHQLVRAQAGDDVVYVAGDLYHHAIEFDESERNVRWVDAPAMRASKEALLARAEREGARVYLSHIAGPHRVGGAASARRLEPIASR
ncbi:MAG: MBL fold metallo-hydrolase [Deinococcales bacterium]